MSNGDKKEGFLCLKLNRGRGIKIGEDVEVFISESKNGSTILAIKAPRSLSIKRIKKEESTFVGRRFLEPSPLES